MSGKERRTRKSDQHFVALIAAGWNIRNAAKECKVSEATGHRWLSDPAVESRVLQLRSAMFDAATGRLAANLNAATDTLIALLDPEHPPRVRLNAARAIVESACNLRQLSEFEARLAALENAGQ